MSSIENVEKELQHFVLKIERDVRRVFGSADGIGARWLNAAESARPMME
jgi:hypothetical protein